MAQVVDRLITEFALRSQPYLKGAEAVTGATQRIGSAIGSVVGRLASLASGAAAVGGAALVGLGVASSKASADLESLKLGLVAVEGSTEAAARRFKDIQQLAKLPSLGIEEAARAYIDLAAAGVQGDLAVRSIQAFGNALATVGKGKEVLANAAYGLRQISTSSTVLAEDLNILKDAVPQVTKILQGLYGTARSEDLAKLVAPQQLVEDLVRELSKLPPVAGGTANAFANFGDAIQSALAIVGDSVNRIVVPALNRVADYVSYLADSGKLAKIASAFENLFNGDQIGNALVNALIYIQTVVELLPGKIATAYDAFVQQFNQIRKDIIFTASALAALFAGAAIIRGVVALVEVYKTLTTVIKGAAAAQAVLTALTGVGVVVVLGALAAGAATLAALDKAIPKAGKFDVNSALAGPSFEDEFKKNKADYEKAIAGDPAKKKTTTTQSPTPTGMAIVSQLDQLIKSNERVATNTEKMVDVQTQLYGGSVLAETATSEYGLSKLNRGRGARTEIHRLFGDLADQIVGMLNANSPLKQRARMTG